MSKFRTGLRFAFGLGLVAAGCGGSSSGGNIFQPKPECMGDAVTPYMGQHQMVISTLAIGKKEDGFDLDGDGMPDNRLAGLGGLAKGAIEDAFKNFSIVIPLEFFDFPSNAADKCVKFAFYLGAYTLDKDGDGGKSAKDSDDCNDTDPMIGKGMPEVADNGIDDDCDGLTDEDANNMPSTSTADGDMDGVTIADGDCDDTNAMVHPGAMEICGDGLDNDCSHGADFSTDAQGNPVCSPFDLTPDTIPLDPLSFNNDGSAKIVFNSGDTTVEGGVTKLHAGPSLFSVSIPVTSGVNLELRISGATIESDVVTVGSDIGLANGRLGGVLDGETLDQIRGLTVDQINLKPEDSLLDAIFANPTLQVLLALDKIDTDGDGVKDCYTPDIDVDQDGIEAFCDSNPDDMVYKVDTCIDGDGTVYHDGDMGSTECSAIKNADGSYKFVDGISVVLTFQTVPAVLAMP